MSNPFEEPDGRYLVLKNDEGQYSLWPERIEVPLGWRRVHGPAGRDECLAVVDREWTDLRPASLRGSAETGPWEVRS